MPVHNADKYVGVAIESILNQTFSNFELLIINDGSTDNSATIIHSYKDARIRYVENNGNLGLIKTLNYGLTLAQGDFIARMDADDISQPFRLEKQVEFMTKNPHIGVCGTWIRTFGANSYTNKYPTNSDEIKSELLFQTSIGHATTMIRKDIIKKFNIQYDPNYSHAEDYELWTRISESIEFANIPDILYRYRIHNQSVSNAHANTQLYNARRVRARELRKIDIEPSETNLTLHTKLTRPSNVDIDSFLNAKEIWLHKIIAQNKIIHKYNENALLNTVKNHWLFVCNSNTKHGFGVWRRYQKSDLRQNFITNNSPQIKFLIKCLIKI